MMPAGSSIPVSVPGSKVNRRHFHTFDALRFLAFFKVFLLHLPIYSFPIFSFLKKGGGIGVQFFFVLSGFLITYIILEEKKQTGKLHLKNFFARRILRIWPLYYLMVLVAYTTPYLLGYLGVSSSGAGYEPELWVSLTFLENYKMMVTGSFPNVSPLSVMWSLCIEEHFYIIWGLLLYYVRIDKLPAIIITSVVLAIVSRCLFVYYSIPTSDILTNIDLFAFGAAPAYLLIQKPLQTENYLNNIPARRKQLFALLVLVFVVLCSQVRADKYYILLTTVLGFLFSTLIFLTLAEQNRLKISDSNVLSRMGIYTYGLYLYHTLVINLLLQVFGRLGWKMENAGWAVVFVVASLTITVVISILSYHVFEKQFLKLKRFFR